MHKFKLGDLVKCIWFQDEGPFKIIGIGHHKEYNSWHFVINRSGIGHDKTWLKNCYDPLQCLPELENSNDLFWVSSIKGIDFFNSSSNFIDLSTGNDMPPNIDEDCGGFKYL